jgi:hypothetical protein
MMKTQSVRPLLGQALALVVTWAGAAPVTVSNAGYFLDNNGSNSLGISGGGSPGGTATTLFLANALPAGGAGGTTAAATILGTPTSVAYSAGDNSWVRRAQLDNFQRNALTVTFTNGADSTVVVTRDLFGVPVMPLAPSFTVGGDPFSPLLSWTLPDGPGIDIDRVGIVFYDDDTNLEIGTRVFLPGMAKNYQIQGVLPEGLKLVFSLRLFDLDDGIVPGSPDWTNADILSLSRTYLSYTVPHRVPEPGMPGLALLAGLAAALAGRRQVGRLASAAVASAALASTR